MRLLLAIALLAAGLSAAPAAGAEAPKLREPVLVHGDLVTLDDLFEHAGPAGAAAVFRSPDLGSEGSVAATRIAIAAKQAGLDWSAPSPLDKITVKRPSRIVPMETIAELVRMRVASETGAPAPESIEVTFPRGAKPIEIDARIQDPATILRIDLQRGGGFRAVIGIENHDEIPERSYSGRALEMVEMPVPVIAIEREATVSANDVKTVRVPRDRLSSGLVTSVQEIVGMAAKRALPADRPVRVGDLGKPLLVRKNEVVTIIFVTPGLMLKSQGRALADGAENEFVSVENAQSKRMVQATVQSPGVVVVTAASRATSTAAATSALETRRTQFVR